MISMTSHPLRFDSNVSVPLDTIMPLDAPQPVLTFPPLAEIEETPEEDPIHGLPLVAAILPSYLFCLTFNVFAGNTGQVGSSTSRFWWRISFTSVQQG